jgi:membrane protein YdbS with pleckstrin-like domain
MKPPKWRRMQRFLEPGERVRLETRPHEVSLARPLARAVALAGVGAVLIALGLRYGWGLGAAGVLALAGAAVVAFADVWRWHATHVIVTTEKLIVVHGVLRRHAAAVRLARGTLAVRQGVLGRALGYGTVVAGELEIPYVPREVATLLG